MLDLLVVGGGLFGKIIAATAAREGMATQVISDERPGAGSPAAGCVIRPSWISSMSRAELEDAMVLLRELFVVREVEFELPLGKRVTCSRVEPSSVLGAAHLGGEVYRARDGGVVMRDQTEIEARSVVVAAGIWTSQLCPWIGPVEGRWGWSHRGPPIGRAVISPWAPYRQVVAFDMDDGESWSGDGSAYKLLSEGRAVSALGRCLRVTGYDASSAHTTLGARPYCDTGGAPCLISRRGRVWAVTGGAKNGTAAAAWAARRVVREVQT